MKTLFAINDLKKSYLTYFLLLVYIFQFIVFFNNSFYGLDFSDESFYLLNITYPEKNLFSISNFGYFLKPLLYISKGNISFFRILSFIIFQVVVIFFSISLLNYLNENLNIKNRLNLNKVQFILFNLNISFLYYFLGCNITPSYNFLNLLFILTFLIGLFLSVKKEYGLTLISFILIIFSGLSIFLIKPTTAIGIFITTILWFFLEINNKKRFLTFSIFFVMLIVLTIYIINQNLLTNIIEIYKDSIYFNNQFPTVTLQTAIFRVLRLTFNLIFNHILILILVLFYINEKFNFIRNNFFKIVFILLLLFVSCKFYLQNLPFLELIENYSWILMYNLLYILTVVFVINKNYTFNYLKLIFLVPIIFLLIFYGLDNWKVHIISIILFFISTINFWKKNNKTTLLFFTFILLSISYSFGTTNPYLYHSIACSILIINLIYILILKIETNTRFNLSKIFITTIVIFSCQSVISYRLKPYQQEPLTKANIINTNFRLNKSIKLNLHRNEANYIKKIESLALNNGWNQKSKVLDITGKTPAINIILNCPFEGTAWLLGGYYNSNEKNNFILNKLNISGYNDLWVLKTESTKNDRSINLDENFNFPNNYIKLGNIVRNPKTNEVHSLWRRK
tara:strand:+ start:13731 stop:15602 length:1872 start_codon:yes stop_codon:yes gene_type:complete